MRVRRAPVGPGSRRSRRPALLSSALLVVLFLPGSAQASRAGHSLPTSQAAFRTPPRRLAAGIRTEARALHRLGVSVAVSRGGKLEWAAGFGSADLAAKVPTTARTVYQIGSITKTFTAALVMQLVEEGKLTLADPVGQFVRGLPWGHKVTIAELLNHTSGIVDYVNSKPSLLGPDCPLPSGSVARCPALTPAQVASWLAHHPLMFTPGTRFSYSNSNYYLLGLVIERATGEPYGRYLKRRIIAPLGLSHTGPCPERMRPPSHALGYLLGKHVVPVSGSYPLDSEAFAAGELCSTVGDLVTWIDDLAHGRVVSTKTYKEMATASPASRRTFAPYGYGLMMSRLGTIGGPVVGSGGITTGYTSFVYHFPDSDLDVAVCSNTASGTGLVGAALQAIVDDIVSAYQK